MIRVLVISAIAAVIGTVSQACTEAEWLPDGSLQPSLAFSDLDAVQQEGVSDVLSELADPEALTFISCDLSENGTAEVIVFGGGPDLCEPETGDCLTWILEDGAYGWEPVMEGSGAMSLAISTSMGRPDVVTTPTGSPPVVHKFDGAAWRAALSGMVYGEDEDFLELPDVGIEWGGVEATSYLPEHRAIVASDDAGAFDAGFADLDGDGASELIVRGKSEDWCEPSACTHWVYRLDGGLDLLLEARGADMEVMTSSSGGWQDVALWTTEGHAAFRWDGTAYR